MVARCLDLLRDHVKGPLWDWSYCKLPREAAHFIENVFFLPSRIFRKRSDDSASQEQTDGAHTQQHLYHGAAAFFDLPDGDEVADAPKMNVKVEPAETGFQADPIVSQKIATWNARFCFHHL